MDAFNKTSYFKKEPEIGFGTGSRPPLMVPTATPGPGAYQIKTTLTKTIDSTIKSPEQYTIRSRHTFGDPNLKALSKSTANEPGTINHYYYYYYYYLLIYYLINSLLIINDWFT